MRWIAGVMVWLSLIIVALAFVAGKKKTLIQFAITNNYNKLFHF